MGVLSESLAQHTRNFIVNPTGLSMGGRSEYRLNNLTQPFSLATTMGNSGTRCDDVVRMRVILSCGHRLVEALRVGLSGQGRHAIVGPKSRPQFGLSTDPVRTRVRTKVRTKYGPSTNQSTNQVRTQYEPSTDPVRTKVRTKYGPSTDSGTNQSTN